MKTPNHVEISGPFRIAEPAIVDPGSIWTADFVSTPSVAVFSHSLAAKRKFI